MTHTLNEITRLVEGELIGDGLQPINGVAPFETASAAEITLAEGPKQLKQLKKSSAGAYIVPVKGVETDSVPNISFVRVKNPRVAFARVMALFYPPAKPKPGIDPTVKIGPNFTCGANVSIAAGVTIGCGVSLGAGVVLEPGAVVGDRVRIGDGSAIQANVTIRARCIIGCRVTIQAGSVIGSDGFGFAPDGETWAKIPQVGIVRIDDDVEIGAGNTIDRATFGQTWIQKGVKTDNLVHIAHNVTVGENSLIVAQAGIGGSVTIGRHVIIAGQVAVRDHVTIGNNASIGGQSGVSKSVEPGQIMSGTFAMPHSRWLRVQRVLPDLPDLSKKVAALEKRLAELEKNR